jgi:hypothetical protein
MHNFVNSRSEMTRIGRVRVGMVAEVNFRGRSEPRIWMRALRRV